MGISGNADVRLGLYLFGKCGCEWIGHGNGKLQMADSGKTDTNGARGQNQRRGH